MEVADESDQPYYIDSYVHSKHIIQYYVLNKKKYEYVKKFLHIYK